MALYVDERGDRDAPAILFLHGGGVSSRQWQPQLDALTEFHLLAPDLPEQGQSAAVTPFTVEHTLAQLTMLITQRVPTGRVHLVGLSLGGALALTLLARTPEIVASTFVSGCAVQISPLLAGISRASSGLYALLPPRWLADQSLKQFGVPAAAHDLIYDDLVRTATPAFTRRTVDVLVETRAPARAERLLVAVGSRETAAARSAALGFVRHIDGARGVQVPEGRHLWNLQFPALFTATVRAWVTGAALPAELQPLE